MSIFQLSAVAIG